MNIKKTSYGMQVVVPKSAFNSEFTFLLRQVGTLNSNIRCEQALINRLEVEEKRLTRKFLLLAFSMENFFKGCSPAKFNEWEQHNRMDWNEYYHDQMNDLLGRIDDISFQFARESKHGWCL